ncbi:hypothetical protein JXO52_11525 [bacterium]|nr:hypothetical protein [bacterium]
MSTLKIVLFLFLAVLFFTTACGLVESERQPPRFVLNVTFRDADGTMGKQQLTDLVWVLVADISRYDSLTVFQNSTAAQNYFNFIYNGPAATEQVPMSRDLMKHFLTEQDSVSLFSEQELRIATDSTASGTVSGIEGLNWLIIGFEERGIVNYLGQAVAAGRAGETTEVPVEVYYVENYNYY